MKSPLKDLAGDQTLTCHQRVGSHYSQGIDSELAVAPPRRKTVGFKENQKLEGKRTDIAISGSIAVEDVETNKSHSIFERASRASEDFEQHKSSVKEKSPPNVDKDGDPGAPASESQAPHESDEAVTIS